MIVWSCDANVQSSLFLGGAGRGDVPIAIDCVSVETSRIPRAKMRGSGVRSPGYRRSLDEDSVLFQFRFAKEDNWGHRQLDKPGKQIRRGRRTCLLCMSFERCMYWPAARVAQPFR